MNNTEEKIYNYFASNKIIESYIKTIELYKNRINEIDNKLKTNDIDLAETTISGYNYIEKVQVTKNIDGPVERKMMEITSKLIKEKNMLDMKMWDIENKISEINLESIEVGYLITILNQEEIKIAAYRYKDKKTNRQISFLMNMSEPTVSRVKNKIIKHMKEVEGLYKFDMCV